MASSKGNPEPGERRTLHSLIAICLLVVAQVNLLLHPGKSPADTNSKSEEPTRSIIAEPAGAQRQPIKSSDVREPDNIAAAPLQAASLDEPPANERYSAFALVREGNQYLSKRSQGKVVEIISGKAMDGLTPTDWRVVYYDAEARFKAVEIRFSGNEITRVFEPGRFLELFSERARKPISPDLLKIDSDTALEIALRKTGLTQETATRAEFKLETARDGMPVWKINYWGQVDERESHLGEIILSAYDGRIVKNRVHAVPQLHLARSNSKIAPENRF